MSDNTLSEFDRLTFYLNEASSKKCFGSLGVAIGIAKNLRTQLAERDAQLEVLKITILPIGNYGNSEGTANPYWLIINPCQMFKPDAHTVANMITGPFFSREAAQQHLNARRYAFGKHAVVYCHSAYWSKEYRALQEAIRQPTQANNKGDE